MVHEYNIWASTQSNMSKMTAYVGNFLDPADPSPIAFDNEEFQGFDLAVVGFGFHQFIDPMLATARLAERLKNRGVLLILDFVVDGKTGGDGDDHGHGNGHRFWPKHGHGGGGDTATKEGRKRGFEEDDMKTIFESAGLGKGFGFEVIAKKAVFETAKHSMTADVFIARGTK
jgi:hypothetical protein